jgi:hypothetical protein
MKRSAHSVRKMMKASIQFTALLLLISACAPAQTELAGTYKSADTNLIKKGWKYIFEGYDGFTMGTELELKTDSTFHMVTCGNILTGVWHHTEDSLYLTYQTNRWRSDSLHEHGFEGKWPELAEDATEALLLKGNQLIVPPQDDGYKLYDVLEK